MNTTSGALRQVAGGLPVDVTSFVGRRRATAHVRQLLSESRLVTLTGVGGVGKSRLALHVAREVWRAFPDGVWLVEFAKLEDASLVASTVTAALGLSDSSARLPAEVLTDYLADKWLLLILDNCEHLLGACARLVADLLPAAPGVRALVTSREPLGVDGERSWSVPPLTVPGADSLPDGSRAGQYEALRLFEERAASVRSGFKLDSENGVTVARLCRRLDGLPLAIELAAAGMREHSVAEILARLRDRYRLPPAGDGTTQARHQTLRATVRWSFDLCSALERTLWARLSVFAGEFDLEAAEAVCPDDSLDVADVFTGIAGLLDKSILIRGEEGARARYRMLETIRQFGAECLASRGEEADLRRRHRDYFLHLAERCDAESCGPRQAEWSRRLHAERANLWAALEFCLQVPDESRSGLRMSAALWFYWIGAGFVKDGRYWLDRTLATGPEPTKEWARALWINGWIAIIQGDESVSLTLLRQALELAQKLGDGPQATCAMQYLGVEEMFTGNSAEAIPILQEALARHRAAPEWTAPGLLIFSQLARTAGLSGETERAVALLKEGITICESLEEHWCRSWTEWDLGVVWWAAGNLENAATHLRESLRRKLALNDRLGIAFCLEVLSWVAVATGDPRRAAMLFGAAEKGWDLIGMPLFGFDTLLTWRERGREQTRKVLGEPSFEAARRHGLRLTPEDAVAAALGEPPPPPSSSGPQPVLTKREAEIAAMITQGMSNKEIAAALVIAQRTVEGHVEHILTKLGFTTRTQIPAWIAEHDGD